MNLNPNRSNNSSIKDAFDVLQKFNHANSINDKAGLIVHPALQRMFANIVEHEPMDLIVTTGVARGIAPVTIINLIILHGGYFRLIESGFINRSDTRFIDSLYHPCYPSLSYNTINADINAPWITLSAQEALLDIELSKTTVIEYGSGISTFFFNRFAKSCYSFEDNGDPNSQKNWIKLMEEQSSRMGIKLNLLDPTPDNTSPQVVTNNLWDGVSSLLVNIDGIDRPRHFNEWGIYMTENRHLEIIILLDNSDISRFCDTFDYLWRHKASIFHHYGNVYGQLTTKQCTSFITYHQNLMVSASPSPHRHDIRWGKMNCQ